MAFNFGAFAGGLGQGAQQGFQLYKNVKNFNDEQKLQQDMKSAPQVGADNTQYVYQNPDVKQVTQADRDQYIQDKILQDTGNVDAASRYALQSKQGQYYGAETVGKTQQNQDYAATQKSLQGVIDNAGSMATQYDAGKLGAKDIVGYANQYIPGGITTNRDGTLTAGGHTIDPNNPNDMKGLLSTAALYHTNSVLRGTIQGNAIANQNVEALAHQTTAGAVAQNADTQRMIAPSEIARNQGAAAQSNAEASTAPARISALNAQAASANSEVGVHNAQAGYYGAETDNINTQRQYDLQSQAIQADIEAKAAKDPNYMGSPQMQQDIARLNLSSKPNIYGRFTTDVNNNATRESIAAGRNRTALNVAAMRQQGVAGKGGSTFRQDAANPNVWHDTRNPGRAMQFDPKTGNIAKISGIPAPKGTATDPTTGLPTATDKNGQAGYLRADGQWDSDPTSALSSYGPGGVPSPNAGNPQGVNPPLPPAGYQPSAAMPGYPGLPS